ncbi:MAG: sensor histidine kinase [Limnohabitans sp.]|nr:sensor histidine kinase [Limnohabitans sp.]
MTAFQTTPDNPHGQAGVSLARQLLIWVLLPQLVLWMAGGVATYKFAAGYANQAVDASLLQASRALARQLKPIGNGLLIDFPRAAQDVLEADPADKLLYMVSSPPGQFILGNQSLPAPVLPLQEDEPVAPALNTPYFYDGNMPVHGRAALHTPPGQPLRLVALYLRFGDEANAPQTMLVQVARSSANSEELARRILVDMLLPMSSLVLLMTVIVWLGIRAGLAPLARLRQQVEGRNPTDLAPLQLASAPRELWSLATALNTLLAAVQSNVSTQKRFIGDAAHQLRTPLAGLKSQTEIALQSTTDPDLKARLQRVHDSATRSAHLVNQLLTLARAEPESVLAHDRHRFDLHRMAQTLTAEWVPRALRAHIDLGMDEAASTPVWVVANELLVREALTNLIDNALHYAGAGSQVTVNVASTANHEALLEVSDTGPGIEAASRERVFERFVRATEAGNGCGLGLAIVREIVERHAGRVSLHDASPHGLCVRVHLPLAEADH